ncbi:uncharacterized protein LOC135391304 [Ornithodoros turicata]|uniref:uncharacterized protein LOC135391304 n=1 Tax=Ornithodoros turicata TaxID=34597 RepID=UPI0031399F71
MPDVLWEAGLVEILQNLFLLKTAHFLNVFEDALDMLSSETYALVQDVIERAKETRDDFWHGILLMDYNVQATAAAGLEGGVFLTLAQANATTKIDATHLVQGDVQLDQLPNLLCNLYVGYMNKALCSCLQRWQRHGDVLALLHRTLRSETDADDDVSALAKTVHDRINLTWKNGFKQLFETAVQFIADLEEQVQTELL